MSIKENQRDIKFDEKVNIYSDKVKQARVSLILAPENKKLDAEK